MARVGLQARVCRGAAFALLFVGGHAKFGHEVLSEFSFPEGWTNLNQGSYGACPNYVRQARREYQDRMDASPEAFFRVNMTGDGHSGWADLIDRARGSLAAYLHTAVDNIVLVDNASTGLNVVLRSVAQFLKGRAVLYLDTAYVEVKAILSYLAGTRETEPSSRFLKTPLIQVTCKVLEA